MCSACRLMFMCTWNFAEGGVATAPLALQPIRLAPEVQISILTLQGGNALHICQQSLRQPKLCLLNVGLMALSAAGSDIHKTS